MYLPRFRSKKNGVPVLSKDELDIMAERFLADYDHRLLQVPMALDIDSFALNHLGLKQDFQFLSHNGIYLGMTVFNDTNKVPVYSPETKRAEYISAKARTIIIDNDLLQEEQEVRYRFTMGHEAGHDIFHSAYYAYNPNQISLFDRGDEPLVVCRAVNTTVQKPVDLWTDHDTMEWQANYFSAALLMPKSVVISLIKSLPEENIIFRNAVYVHELVEKFNVSWQAAEIRLKGLGIITKKSIQEAAMGMEDAFLISRINGL